MSIETSSSSLNLLLTNGSSSVIIGNSSVKMKRNSKAQSIVWNFLLDRAGEKFYLTQIAKKTKISDSTVHQILEKKANRGLVKKEKLGNLSLYSLNQSSPSIRQEKVLRTTRLLESLIKQLKECSQKIILYGSAAGGQNRADSDIDVFVVSNEKGQVYKFFSQSKIKNRVRLVVKNYLEWLEMKEKDKFFFDEINKGKILWDKNEEIVPPRLYFA